MRERRLNAGLNGSSVFDSLRLPRFADRLPVIVRVQRGSGRLAGQPDDRPVDCQRAVSLRRSSLKGGPLQSVSN